MSNSSSTLKEKILESYLPVILGFFAVVAAGTCLSAGPFFPVGFAGIVAIVVTVWLIVVLSKRHKQIDSLNEIISANEDRIESLNKRHASDIAKRDGIIEEMKETINMLQKEVKDLTAAKEEVKEEVKEEPKEEVKEEKSETEAVAEKKPAKKKKTVKK